MELKEARKWADVIAKIKVDDLSYCEKAGILLDDRITELEAENEILLQQALDRENWKASAEEALGRITELEAQRDELKLTLQELLQTADYGYSYHSYYMARQKAKSLLKKIKRKHSPLAIE